MVLMKHKYLQICQKQGVALGTLFALDKDDGPPFFI
jgi:hypothetical protein